MTTKITFRALPLFVLFSASAFGGPLTINFTSSLLTAGRGQTITFSGNIANTDATAVFLNSDSLNIAAPLTADDTKFFLNSPLSIAPFVTTPTFQIFDVTVPLGAPFGLYPGVFDILGGSTPNDFGTVGTATFAVNVVPEPATFCLLLAGTICVGLILRRRPLRASCVCGAFSPSLRARDAKVGPLRGDDHLGLRPPGTIRGENLLQPQYSCRACAGEFGKRPHRA